MKVNSVLIVVATIWTGAASAQICPAGSRQVQNGYVITCICPDGSQGSIYGCPQRTVPQQQQQATPQTPVKEPRSFALRSLDALEDYLEKNRPSTAAGQKISDASKNFEKPQGYDYTRRKPLEVARGSQTASPAAIVGTGASNIGEIATQKNSDVNNWKDGGPGQINVIPQPNKSTPVTTQALQQQSLVSQAVTGFKRIGQDILGLPSNAYKFVTGNVATPPAQHVTTERKSNPMTSGNMTQTPATKQTSGNDNYQSAGTGKQSSFGEISSMQPVTPAKEPTGSASNSVNIPYNGYTSTFPEPK